MDIYGGETTTLQKYKTIKEECNKRPYTITVDVPSFGGVLLEYKRKKPTAKKQVK